MSIVSSIHGSSDIGAGSFIRGPQQSITCPVGAVAIPTSTPLATAIAANPAGTTFCLAAGVHPVTNPVTPKTGNTFVGAYGAIIDCTGWVPTSFHEAPFTVYGPTVNSVTLRNLIIRNGGQANARAIHAGNYNWASGWIIEYCEIYNFLSGISLSDAAILRNCYIHDCNGDSQGGIIPNGGYIFNSISNSVIEQNEIALCGDIQKCINGTSKAPDNNIFRRNFIHHCGTGWWLDGDNTNFLIENNTIDMITGQGIHSELGGAGIIRNNLVTRAGLTGIFISTSRDEDTYNNVITDCWRGITLQVNLQGVFPPGLPDPSDIGWDLRNNRIFNNIMTISGATPANPFASTLTTVAAGDPSPYLSNSKNNVWSSNHYYINPTPNYFVWGNNVYNYAGWLAIPQDAGSAIN